MERHLNNVMLSQTEQGRLYPGMSIDARLQRLEPAFKGFAHLYGVKRPRIFSAPGRTELCGNHTDHQRGRVIAASVALDDVAAVLPNNESVIRLFSDKYGMITVNLDSLAPQEGEKGTSTALVRGITEYFKKQGYRTGGFNAYTSNLVPVGSGLSSSAAFEVLIASIMNGLFCDGEITPEELARAGQYAENTYFGKPCGLMDQMASAIGGVIKIDFANPETPDINRLPMNLTDYGYMLCIIDTGVGHDNLNSEYTAIPSDMTDVAIMLHAEKLGCISPEKFYADLPSLRGKVSDRSLLRALHFYKENDRVLSMEDALERRDFERFLTLIQESGRSSWMLLQNIYPNGAVWEQSAALSLAWCENILGNAGACRIHGGGFGGTIQAFVPLEMAQPFREEMERLTGAGSCRFLPIREAGGVEIIM